MWLMTDQDLIKDTAGKAACGDPAPPGATDWVVPASLALTAVVAVNSYIVWYLLVSIPAGCRELSAESNGTVTCGLEPGAYIISGISVTIIALAIYAFVRWNMTRCRNRKACR